MGTSPEIDFVFCLSGNRVAKWLTVFYVWKHTNICIPVVIKEFLTIHELQTHRSKTNQDFLEISVKTRLKVNPTLYCVNMGNAELNEATSPISSTDYF